MYNNGKYTINNGLKYGHKKVLFMHISHAMFRAKPEPGNNFMMIKQNPLYASGVQDAKFYEIGVLLTLVGTGIPTASNRSFHSCEWGQQTSFPI